MPRCIAPSLGAAVFPSRRSKRDFSPGRTVRGRAEHIPVALTEARAPRLPRWDFVECIYESNTLAVRRRAIRRRCHQAVAFGLVGEPAREIRGGSSRSNQRAPDASQRRARVASSFLVANASAQVDA